MCAPSPATIIVTHVDSRIQGPVRDMTCLGGKAKDWERCSSATQSPADSHSSRGPHGRRASRGGRLGALRCRRWPWMNHSPVAVLYLPGNHIGGCIPLLMLFTHKSKVPGPKPLGKRLDVLAACPGCRNKYQSRHFSQPWRLKAEIVAPAGLVSVCSCVLMWQRVRELCGASF